MAEETPTESAPVEQTDAAPETQAPDNGIFPEKTAAEPEAEESAPSDQSESKDESESASDAATKERPDSELRATETAKRQAIELRELKRQLRQIQQTQQQQQPKFVQPPAKPRLEEFEDIAKYDEALDKWKEDDRQFAIQQDRMARERQAQQEQLAKTTQELKADWDKKSQRLIKQNPEFNVAEALQRVEPSPTMDGWFVDSPVGPEMLDYFDQNPDEADRIRELAPFKAVRELYRLEEKLSNQVKGIKAKPSVVKPPVAVSGRASAPAAPKSAADVLYG